MYPGQPVHAQPVAQPIYATNAQPMSAHGQPQYQGFPQPPAQNPRGQGDFDFARDGQPTHFPNDDVPAPGRNIQQQQQPLSSRSGHGYPQGYPQQQQPGYPPSYPQPHYQPQPIALQLPPGVPPGSYFSVGMPDGSIVQIQFPPQCKAGDTVMVVPPPPPGMQQQYALGPPMQQQQQQATQASWAMAAAGACCFLCWFC